MNLFKETWAPGLPEHLPAGKAIQAEWYDADYFKGGLKSNWTFPYTWKSFSHIFNMWAKNIRWSFPEAQSYLEVGCATGFLGLAWHNMKIRNNFSFEYEGFDFSQYAIINTHRCVAPHVSIRSVDDFKFKRKYDVMVSLDVFEHLTEAQAFEFLKRSREYINDALFFVIALDQEHQRDEPSHINLQTREYWHDLFTRAGWTHGDGTGEIEDLARHDISIESVKCEPFVYSSGAKS